MFQQYLRITFQQYLRIKFQQYLRIATEFSKYFWVLFEEVSTIYTTIQLFKGLLHWFVVFLHGSGFFKKVIAKANSD